MKNLSTVVPGHQAVEIALVKSDHKKANALREQGVGQFNSNIMHGQYTGTAFPQQDDATAIIVGPVISDPSHPDEVSPALLPVSLREPDKTVETDYSLVSNTDFLNGIFGADATETHPIVCGFTGNPNDEIKSKWAGKAWVSGETDTDSPDKNWYFTGAKYSPDTGGTYRRRKDQFTQLNAVVLDDIGTKASGRERLDALPPSWLLETSPGNFQAGYIFAEPLTDGKLAEALVNAIIDAGLCDKGASGPLARYSRTPVGINGKHTPPFVCRLVEWHPELRYTPAQIVEGLELELPKPKASSAKSAPRSAAVAVSLIEDEVYTPRSAENVVVGVLKERGLYKAPLGSGKHDITCPWKDEHTDGVDGGTAYFEPSAGFTLGGFKCLHGHCGHRHIGALLDHLLIAPKAAKNKPTINAKKGELDRVVDAAERELAKCGRYYQRGGLIVSVVTDPGTQETAISAINTSGLARVLSSLAIWEHFDGRAKDVVAIDPPPRHVSVLFDASAYPHMPVLNGIARQPYFRPTGSLMTLAGYDADTGMFGVFNEKEFSIVESPSMADAQVALAEIIGLLDEFNFPSDHDKSAALAGILTAAIRPSLRMAPMFHVKAPQISSGKS